MPEHASGQHHDHADLGAIHAALDEAYSEALTDLRNKAEGLDRAACGPHLTHLAELAAAAAAGGASASTWRDDILASAGLSAAGPLDAAETCMRQSGLWPWNP